MMIRKINLKYVSKYKVELMLLGIVIVFGIVLNSYSPILYGRIIDSITDKTISSLGNGLVWFAILNLIILILSSFEGVLAEYLSNKIIIYNQKKLYSKVMRARFDEIENIQLGVLISNLTTDVAEIVGFSIGVITSIVSIIMNIAVPLVLIFLLSKKLSLIVVVFLPIPVIVYRYFKYKKKKLQVQSKDLDDQYYQYIVNSVDNISDIKLYKIEEYVESKFSDVTYKSHSTTLKKTILSTTIAGINMLFLNLFSICILYYAAHLIYMDAFTVGSLISFSMYANRLFEGIDSLQSLKLNEQEIYVSLDRLDAIEKLSLEKHEINNIKNMDKINEIFLKNIFFAYDEMEQMVLQDLSLLIKGNGFYSIVGPNGCGKTTLFKLLVKFYSPQKGDIFINGISYKKITEAEIRNKITYIQKKVFILEGTILDNLRLNKDIVEKEVINACTKVGLMEYINSLPEGIYTHLKADSDDISSGLKQKINFARAILNQSDVMIFDEVSSDLDGDSEIKLCKIMRELAKERIVISISHRINAISMSEYIYYLSSGKVEAEGGFEELVKTSESFKKLISYNS